MNYRCRKLIQTIQTILIIIMVVCPIWNTTFCVSTHIPDEEPVKDLNWYCLDIAKRLDKLGYLSVSPDKFASFMWVVSYCESGHKIDVKGKDAAGSIGLFQMTKETRSRLKVKHGGLKVQAENYFKFLKAGGKRLRHIKNSVDLHCYNFRPPIFTRDTLSQVTNPQLEALDFNKDSVITREDIRLFQKKKLKV